MMDWNTAYEKAQRFHQELETPWVHHFWERWQCEPHAQPNTRRHPRRTDIHGIAIYISDCECWQNRHERTSVKNIDMCPSVTPSTHSTCECYQKTAPPAHLFCGVFFLWQCKIIYKSINLITEIHHVPALEEWINPLNASRFFMPFFNPSCVY